MMGKKKGKEGFFPFDLDKGLQKTGNILEIIQDNTPVAMAFLNPDFNFIMVNRAYAKFNEKDPHFFEGKNLFELYPNKDNEALFRKVVMTGKPYLVYAKAFEFPEHPEWGTTYWDWTLVPVKDEEGNVTTLVLTASNVTARQKTEEALKESEGRFRNLFDNISSGVAVYGAVDDGKDFVFKDYNQAGQLMDNARKEDVVGRKVTEVFPGVEEFGLLDVLREVYRTGKPLHHPVTQYKDERIAGWRENYVFKLFSGEVVAVYDDLTERKKAEQEVLEAKRQLDEAQMVGKMGSWLWNVDRDEIKWSEGMYRLLGISAGDFGGNLEAFEEFVHPDDLELVEETIRRALEENETFAIDHRLVKDNGNVIWCHARGEVSRDNEGGTIMKGTLQDITERKEAEMRYEEASEIAHIGHWERDLDTGKAFWTKETYHINGVDPATFEPTLENLMDIIHPDDRELIKDVLKSSRPGRQIDYEYRIIKTDGTLRYVHSQAEVVKKPGGGIKVIGVIQDITARKAEEEMITRYTIQLEEANQMKELFGDVLRHDIANPLNVISFYTELLMEEKEDDPETLAKLKTVKNALDDAIELVNQASTLSKIESVERLETEELDLSDIMEEIVSRHRSMAEEAGMEVVDMVHPGTMVSANPIIKEVFSNLVSNAVKYASDGGRLVLEGHSEDSTVRVDVVDFGPGIEDGDKEGIFTRFERKDKGGVKGWGLGLAITKRIVELHKGRIWIQDNPEGGCIFSVELPIPGPRKPEPVAH